MTKLKAVNWRDMSLGTKLPLSVFVIVGLLFAGFVFAISYSLSKSVEDSASTEVAEKAKVIVGLVEATDKDLRIRTAALAKAYQASLKGQFELDPEITEVNGKPAPTLKLNGKTVNMDFTVADRFTELTGAVATVFAKTGDDFIRVTTSVKNEKGERAIGTLLDRAHPGYKATLEGTTYTGFANLFGKPYITQYDPIRNAEGKVIGLSFVGLDFSGYVEQLKATLREIKIGKTGYFYVLDARPGKNNGVMLLHPTAEGKSFLDVKDATGREFIKEIMERKNGITHYQWIDKDHGDTSAREKVVAFTYFKGWEWQIVGGTYVDELTAEVHKLRNLYALVGTGMLLLVAVALFLLIRKMIIAPMAQAITAAQALAQGDLTVNLAVTRQDEMGQLMGP